ncbi:MAG: biopolymer transporter ExbD [Planctomycetota bacterium]
MRFAPETQRRRLSLSLTPIIDVVFQLIIFFLFTSQLSQSLRTPLELPPEAGDEQAGVVKAPLVVDVDASGRYLVEREFVELDRVVSLAVALGEEDAAANLLVRADQRAPASAVNALANRLADAGVRAWKLGTAPSGGQ